MSVLTVAEHGAMAKAKKGRGRPRGDRDDAPVKLDRKLVGMAKLIAPTKSMTVAAYLSGLVSAPIHRDYARMLRETEAAGAEGQGQADA